MRPILTALLFAAALALALASAAHAAGANLTWSSSGYGDDKQVRLKSPLGVACNDAGAVVVADTGNGRLVRFDLKDGVLIAGAELKFAKGTPAMAQLTRSGEPLVFDRRGRRVVRLAKDGSLAFVDPLDGPDGAGLSVTAFRLDAADGVYLLESSPPRVRLACS